MNPFPKAGLGVAIAVAGIMAGVARADTWRFALEEADGSVQDAYAEEFRQRIEARSDGEIRVEIYPYGTLGSSAQLTELVQQDAIQFAFASPGHLATVIPEVGVFTLHFLLSDDNEVNEQVLGDARAIGMLEAAYNEQGLELLGVIPEGWMAWTANRPIRLPEDMQGLRIRTMSSPIMAESYRAYGARPTPIPYSEVYSGLQLGQIEAQVNPIFAIEEMRFYEVQDYLIQAKQAQFITTLVAAESFYDSLSEERRQLVDEVTDNLRSYIFAKQAEFNAQRLRAIEANSDIQVSTLSDAQRNAFREKSLPVRDAFIAQAGTRGRQVLEALQQAVAAAEKQRSGG